DELRQLRVVVDDVDLLAAELFGDGAHATAELADAGALGIDGRVVRLDRDLRAVPGFAGERDDLDEPGRDLRDLEGEQLADETGVSARDRDRGALGALRDRRDVDAQPRPVRVLLAGHLLLGRKDRLDRAEVDGHHARGGTLPAGAGDAVALLAAALVEVRC